MHRRLLADHRGELGAGSYAGVVLVKVQDVVGHLFDLRGARGKGCFAVSPWVLGSISWLPPRCTTLAGVEQLSLSGDLVHLCLTDDWSARIIDDLIEPRLAIS